MGLSFDEPLWLALILLALPLGFVALRVLPGSMSRTRAWSAAVARALLVALVAAMLAGAASVRETNRLAVIAVVDASDSMRAFADRFADLPRGRDGDRLRWSEAIRDFLEETTGDRGLDDLFGLVVFDGEAIAVAVPSTTTYETLSVDYRRSEGSDIEGALRYAQLLFPPDAARRILLVSDGVETSGDARRAARELAATTRVDVVPIAYRVEREVMIEAVDVPPQAPSESVVPVRVVLTSTEPATGTLDLLYEGELLDLTGDAPGTGRRVELAPGRTVVEIPVRLGDGVVHRLEPVFTPDSGAVDRLAVNNRAETFTVTPGRGEVLLVEGEEVRGGASEIAEALRAADVPVVQAEPWEVPSDLLALQSYDLVILHDVASEELSELKHGLLAEYVSTLGGGLVMVGGYNAFGAGGWLGTDLEPVLPVHLDIPDEVIVPSAAIAIVLDSSGSMGRPVLGGSKSQQDIANDGAALAIERMDETDLLMVVEFSGSARVVVPMSRNDDPLRNAQAVRGISPDGGTNMLPAMRLAGTELLRAEAGVKHMILLSDGKSQGGQEEMLALARRLGDAGVTISTIAVGDDVDGDTLEAIADGGSGAYYRVTDPNVIPRIFVKEMRVVRRPLVRVATFEPVVTSAASPLVLGADGWAQRPIPPLHGLVLTRPREDPKITYAVTSPDGYPILAHWFVGRGQVAAFTSDADAWTRSWRRGWEGFDAMWTQIARTIARPASERNAELTTEIVGDDLLLTLDALDDAGEPIDGLTVEGSVYAPDGSRVEVRLEQVGPGAYRGRVPARQRGNYVVALAPKLGARPLPAVLGGASRALGLEYQVLRSDVDRMREIAEAGGGRVLALDEPGVARLFDRDGIEPSRAIAPLWRILLVLAIGTFLADVGTRRVAWDRLLTREVADELRRHAAQAVEQRSRAAAETVAGLRGAAGRVAAPETEATAARPAPRAASATVKMPEREPDVDDRLRRLEAAKEARRQALRKEMLDRLSGRTPPGSAPRDEPGDERSGEGDARSTTEGLLAAKRRAAQRRSGEDA